MSFVYWLQCSQCIDGFLGSPTHGNQCYRTMRIDRDFCLDPTTQMDCHSGPSSLMWGRTVFFGVQPKDHKVDIRITLDITSGGVDLYISQFDDACVVDIDRSSGIHHISVHPIYMYLFRNFQLMEKIASNNSSITMEQQNTFLVVRGIRDRIVITVPGDIYDFMSTRFYLVLLGVGSSTHNETYGNIGFRQDIFWETDSKFCLPLWRHMMQSFMAETAYPV